MQNEIETGQVILTIRSQAKNSDKLKRRIHTLLLSCRAGALAITIATAESNLAFRFYSIFSY